MGKGKIARHEQFLLFPQCFQKACFPEASKGVIVKRLWENEKMLVILEEKLIFRLQMLPIRERLPLCRLLTGKYL